ncbi:alpha-2-macroglobulin isoform X2 [Parasteatoda tepidariorum]|uniref:alpha-2-macroglobulin isoform X2 n=1 Tax=Parasteatoda tepidariorum TaxID=114398 RepID=UPI001C72271B|nr:murinoglobulin-2 isoform X2 [Parasteatoda tepidariorum]
MHCLFIFVAFFSFLAICFSQDQDGYIFMSPRTLRIGANNEVIFRRFGSLNAGTLKVQVFNKIDYSSDNETIAFSKKFEISEGETEAILNVRFDLQDVHVFSGRIQINGTFGDQKISGSDTVALHKPTRSIVIIQTDKPLYKPGETVQFRVLRVNKDLKPFKESNKTIAYVEDPKGTRLFQYTNLDLEKGLVQNKFQLTEDPVLGSWSIKVYTGDKFNQLTNFDVKEYVLPKFEVTIKFPSFVLANAKTIPITVCAEYTYGEPASGTLNLNASLERYFYERDVDDAKIPTKRITTEIKGCYTYNLNVKEIESDTSYYNSRSIVVAATVTEDGTGVERSASQNLNRDTEPLKLSFIDGLDYYKPGLPYNGKLKVTNPDGTIVSGEPIEICATINKRRILADWWATKTVQTCRNYTSSSQGLISYTILPQNVDVISISLEAKALNYDPATNKDVGNEPNQLSQPTTSKFLNPYFSPSGSFIQIQPIPQPVACASSQTLKVLFTSQESATYEFYYQVVYQSTVVIDSSIQTSFSPDDDVSAKYEKQNKVINGPEVQLDPPKESIPQSSEDNCPEAQDSKYLPPIGEVSIDIDVNTIMSPSIRVLVYYVKESGEVVADSMEIDVESCFENKVQFAFGDKKQQPGAETTVSITAGSNSLCGIKAIDKSVLLLNNNEQLTKERIFQMLSRFDDNDYYSTNPCYQNPIQPGLQNAAVKSLSIAYPPGGNSYSYQDSLSAFSTSGYLVISNLYIFTRPCENAPRFGPGGAAGSVALGSTTHRPFSLAIAEPGGALQSVSEVRSNFPEAWLFEFDSTNEDGTFQKTVTLPDTITDWVGSAVCINTADGLGISNTTTITGFQAFFIDYTLPVSVIRGEEFTMVVSISSYANASLPVTVTLEDPQGFKVTDNSIDGDICVHPQSSVTLPVTLTATKVGKVQITVSAVSAESSDVCGSSPTSNDYARDAIRKPIEVKPEGFPNENVINTLFCPSENEDNSFSTSVSLKLPKDVVPDSTRAYVDITGNVLGPAINNLENLVQLPTGCGEQNMVKFTPNYLVLDYLTDIGQVTDDIKNRAIRNLVAGYQRELAYRHPDGSFSAFGTTDDEGSMFLTAFVLRSFYEAKRYIYIDDNLITDMQKWIVSKQDTTGCFPNIGRIIDIDLQGGIPDENASGSITAYCLASLLITNYNNKTVVNDAFSCLNDVPPTNPYSQFLYAYAYSLAGYKQDAEDLIEKARQKINRTEGMESFIIVNGTKAIEIETDAYAVLTTLAVGGSASDALPYVRYLTSNLNPNGGFTNTQDTCVGLSALAKYASVVYEDPLNLMVKTTGGLTKSVTLNDQNKLLVQRFKVTDISKSIKIKAKGTGCGLIQTAILFNTKTAPEKKKFSISVRGDCSDPNCNTAKIVTLVSYLPPGQVAGMSIVQIGMITGFSPVRQSLEDLKNDKNNKILRIDVEDNTVIVYFSEISNAVENFSFEVNQVVKVRKAQPGTAKVYDYYANENSASTSYKINSAN